MPIEETLKAVGSAAGFGALLTSLFNLYSLRSQHRRLLEIEGFKKNAALETFRYTELFKGSSEIQALAPVNYDLNDMKTLVEQATDRHMRVAAIFTRVRPLIGDGYRRDADRVASEESALSEELLKYIYAGGKEAPLKELLTRISVFSVN